MITFYGYARNAAGKVEQVFVTKAPGKPTSPSWTGVIYKSDRAAAADTGRLNSEIALKTRSYERMFGAT